MPECGGCQGLGSHRRWCPAVVSRRAATYGPMSEELERIADMVGANYPAVTNDLYRLSVNLREWATRDD